MTAKFFKHLKEFLMKNPLYSFAEFYEFPFFNYGNRDNM